MLALFYIALLSSVLFHEGLSKRSHLSQFASVKEGKAFSKGKVSFKDGKAAGFGMISFSFALAAIMALLSQMGLVVPEAVQQQAERQKSKIITGTMQQVGPGLLKVSFSEDTKGFDLVVDIMNRLLAVHVGSSCFAIKANALFEKDVKLKGDINEIALKEVIAVVKHVASGNVESTDFSSQTCDVISVTKEMKGIQDAVDFLFNEAALKDKEFYKERKLAELSSWDALLGYIIVVSAFIFCYAPIYFQEQERKRKEKALKIADSSREVRFQDEEKEVKQRFEETGSKFF